MTDNRADSIDMTLRGPFLAAHRALRKAVDAHSAQSKSQSTVALLKLRECRGANNDARDKMLRDVRIMKELQAALAEFGGPEQIPLADGFAEYLGGRRRQVELSCAKAEQNAEIVSRMLAKAAPEERDTDQWRLGSAEAQGRHIARKMFLQLFEAAFSEYLVRSNGA